MIKFNNMIKPDKSDKEQWALWKSYRLQESRNFHRQLIEDLGIEEKDFNMKKAFISKNTKKEVVYIFPSEFKKEKGYFFEIIDSDLMPVDKDRKVYRLAPTEHFEEYEAIINRQGDVQYLVPIEELMIVNPYSVAISKSSAVTSSDDILKKTFEKPINISKNNLSLEDSPMSEMTIKDYITIHKGLLVSNKKWLNEIMKSAK